MRERKLPVPAILAAGVGMGVAGDHLLRALGAPGLNFPLVFVGLAASVQIVLRSGGSPPESRSLHVVGRRRPPVAWLRTPPPRHLTRGLHRVRPASAPQGVARGSAAQA